MLETSHYMTRGTFNKLPSNLSGLITAGLYCLFFQVSMLESFARTKWQHKK